jgi:hypothetical protein
MLSAEHSMVLLVNLWLKLESSDVRIYRGIISFIITCVVHSFTEIYLCISIHVYRE